MKRTFWTRNLFIGVLMGLVMVLGVQGTADAISRLTRSSGDLQTVREDREFTIRFSVTLQSASRRPGFKSVPTTDTAGTAVPAADRANMYYDDTDSSGFLTGTDTPVDYATAHNYDQEFISIGAITGATLQKINGHDPVTPHSMYESTHASYATASASQKLSSSVTLTLLAGDPGTVTITITGTTDFGTATPETTTTFTVYIVKASLDVDATTLTGRTNGWSADDTDDPQIDPSTDNLALSGGTFSTNIPITYRVTGPGRVYVGMGERRTSATQTLHTSSAAPVFLDMNGGTNRVAVETPSVALATPNIYIYGRPTMTVTNGAKQKGLAGGRLNEYLAVQVKDAKNRPIPGLAIDFASGATGAMFTPVVGFLYGDEREEADPTTSPQSSPIKIYTDRNGEAKVYYQLGTAGTLTVTATLTSRFTLSKMFNPTIETETLRPTLSILSGNNQRTNEHGDLDDPLVVVVRRSGLLLPEQVVTFRATKGTLYGITSRTVTITGEETTIDLGSSLGYAKRVYAETNARGEAQVRYSQDLGEGSDTVRATIGVQDYEDTDSQRRVIFGINGGQTTGDGSPTPPTPPTPPTTPTTRTPELTIAVSGTGTTRSVTVTATNAQGANVPGLAVTLSGTALTASRTVVSGTATTITVPTEPGSYTLQAIADGYTVGTATITVEAPPQPGALTIQRVGDRVSNQQAFRITAQTSDGSAPSSAIQVTVSGVTLPPRVTIPAGEGSISFTATLPSTSDAHVVTVSATGYDDDSVIVPASAPGQQTRDTSQQVTTGPVGAADSIEIEGDRQLSGTVNQAIRLRVGVHDANDNGVSDVVVTFKALNPGRGTFAGARGSGQAVNTNTDRNGYATVNFTPTRATDTGTITVEAKARGVSAPVTFIIDIEGAPGSATTGDTTAPKTYNRGDEIPISLEDTLTFSGNRTVKGMVYTCVGSGECVVSYGTVARGQIRAVPVKTAAPKTYNRGDEIPISLEDTLTFSGNRTVKGMVYTCVGSGECVVSYGTVARGQIRAVAASPTAPRSATEINPVVKVNAANRPPMLWVDGGKIYALVGAEVQVFLSDIEGALNIAVAGNKVYWTAQTGESAGSINSANLDGSGAKELTAIKAVPMGIAVDVANSKLYWTNSRGRIQSSNLDGSRIANVLQNLSGPMDIAIGRSNLYWTEYDATAGEGNLGIANSTGRGTPKYVSTGSDMPGSLVVAGNKVYWTEMTGTSAGSINSATLSGTDVKQLASIRAVPVGIAVDTARSKLYWTNSRGRIQSANLDGSKIANVVDGLGMPGDMVLSNSIKAPTATTAKSTTTAAAKNKYDVNGDGVVDKSDRNAVATASLTDNPNMKYDVNGDGSVDALDVLAVTDNYTPGAAAAAAPTLLGMKLSAVEIDRLQAQIDLLIATGDRSPAAMKTLIYLQQLLAMARPEKTQLLANYPNPFNPETWIPYELATDTDVRLTIYNTHGVVVRVLPLGHQSAGYYTDRERAAYWDGRNALGEQVASGIYFYQLETDEISSLRKMVILK